MFPRDWKNNLVSKILALPAWEPELHPQRLHKMPVVMVYACNLSTGEVDSGESLGKAHRKRVISKARGKWVLEMIINLCLKSPTPLIITKNVFTLFPRERLKSLVDVAFTETPRFLDDLKSCSQGWWTRDPRVSKPIGTFPATSPMLRAW